MKKGYASQAVDGVSVFTRAGAIPMGNAREEKNKERLKMLAKKKREAKNNRKKAMVRKGGMS